MKIRPAHASDVADILALERSTPLAAHWGREKYEEIFAQTGLRRMLVLEDQRSIHGFIVARAVGDEWEIENIAVENASIRQGLGSQLLRALLTQAVSEKVSTIWLEVRESNQPAQRLYEKFLFKERSRRAHYYRGPDEGAIIYTLYL